MEFDSLPPHLYRQSRLLRQNLGIAYSSTGDFRDLLRAPAANPIIHQHLWMLDDLAIADGPARGLIEKHLFRAAFYTFACMYLDDQERLGNPPPEALSGWLVRQTSAELAMVVAGDSDFWARHRRRWESYGDATIAIEDLTYGSNETELWTIQAARAAPSAVGPLAVAAARGRQDLDQIEKLLDHLGFVEVVRADLAGMMRHLARGWVSPAVRQMVSPLGVDLREPPKAEVIMGEIVLTGAVEPMVDICLMHLQRAEVLAEELQLPTFGSYSRHLAAAMSKRPVHIRPPRAVIEAASATLQSPVQMAVGFLLADPTFQEAWETHRWGLLGAVEMSARFPAGLILEILAEHAVGVTELIDDFYRSTEERRFAYYDHLAARAYVESDTLGLLLRLYKHSSRTDWHRKVLGEFLELLSKHAHPDGRLPVWLVERDQFPAMVLGEGCGTIEANLLRGLLDYQSDKHMSLIMPAARRLLGDYAARGASVNVNYPQPYTRAVLAVLIDQLEERDPQIPELAPASERLRGEIARPMQRARTTPQEAACLIWSCSRPGFADLHQESWKAIVTSGQSFDGGWAAEPFFFAPSSGGRTLWYSSKLLTTALCFQALSMPTPGG